MMCGLLGLAAILIGGCAATEAPTVLQPVGPPSSPVTRRLHETGFLMVYTPIIEPNIKPDTQFYPHTAYAIYDSYGAFYQTVRNHMGAWDESPYLVSLPSGKYTVRTVSEFTGDVVIPVIIKRGRTTVVNLQRHEHVLAEL